MVYLGFKPSTAEPQTNPLCYGGLHNLIMFKVEPTLPHNHFGNGLSSIEWILYTTSFKMRAKAV